jgi:hypothetical protein
MGTMESAWQAVLAYQSNPLYLRYYVWTERAPEAVQAFVLPTLCYFSRQKLLSQKLLFA